MDQARRPFGQPPHACVDCASTQRCARAYNYIPFHIWSKDIWKIESSRLLVVVVVVVARRIFAPHSTVGRYRSICVHAPVHAYTEQVNCACRAFQCVKIFRLRKLFEKFQFMCGASHHFALVPLPLLHLLCRHMTTAVHYARFNCGNFSAFAASACLHSLCTHYTLAHVNHSFCESVSSSEQWAASRAPWIVWSVH